MNRAILFFLLATPLLAQQKPATTQNPLDTLHNQAKAVFEKAGFPFSEDQERSISLMIEDRRVASEDLFGQLMDFRSGPVQGQQQDRAVAAIKWMNDEFRKRLREYLTEEQIPIWEKYETGDGVRALDDLIRELTGGSGPKQETQFMRIINNSFTAEQSWFSGGSVNTDVVQRAGLGAYHGNFAYQFKDEALNARNPYGKNRPPYQERRTNLNLSGPAIRNRLSFNVNANHNVRETAGTIAAKTPDGDVNLGIAYPNYGRYFGGNATYQLSNVHSLNFGTNLEKWSYKNSGIGGFNLLERASEGGGDFRNFYFNETAVISDKTLYRTNVNLWWNNDEQTPVTNAVTIDVLGAFGSGGAPYRGRTERRGYNVSNLFSHSGQKFSFKAGFDGGYRKSRSVSEDNFLGWFTFTNLDTYRQGIAETYRRTFGNPVLENGQFEMSAYAETDIKVNQRLTTMFGVRYDHQSNLADHNNAAPRVGFAYAAGRSTVVRGGIGIYYDRLWDWVAETLKRSDGTRQYEVVVKNAAFLDPLGTGTASPTPPPSIRVRDRDLAAQYNVITSVSVERTFKNNLFVSGRYEFRRGLHLFRSRDLNASLPGQTVRPDSNYGNVLNLESTGAARSHVITISARQRFSIFNVNGSYTFYRQFNDGGDFFGTPSDNFNLGADWGRTGTAPHQFNMTMNARLFMGVFLTGTMNANAGNFYNVTVGADCNGDTNINDRPTDAALKEYLTDLAAFRQTNDRSRVKSGTYYCGIPGTIVGRNRDQGPGFLNFNFNISKAFFIKSNGTANSGPNVNLFANMNNAFNRTNRGTPSGIMTSIDTFGLPYSARNAREVEVGLRFQF